MNVSLWKDILEQFCDRTHSQYGIVAIISAVMITVNKEIWKAFLEVRATHVHKQAAKRKKQRIASRSGVKKETNKRQLAASDQVRGVFFFAESSPCMMDSIVRLFF